MSSCSTLGPLSKLTCQQQCLAVLAGFNIGLLVINFFEINLLSLAIYKSILFMIAGMVKFNLLGISNQECSFFSKENLSKAYFNIHDKSNKALDCLRRMINLQDIKSLLKTVTVLLFVNTIGSCFSSLTIIAILLDCYALYRFASSNEQVKAYKTKGTDFVQNMVINRIPKYVESEKKSN